MTVKKKTGGHIMVLPLRYFYYNTGTGENIGCLKDSEWKVIAGFVNKSNAEQIISALNFYNKKGKLK